MKIPVFTLKEQYRHLRNGVIDNMMQIVFDHLSHEHRTIREAHDCLIETMSRMKKS